MIRRTLKSISVLLIAVIAAQDAAWAAPVPPRMDVWSAAGGKAQLPTIGFEVPSSAGFIEDGYRAPDPKGLVVLLQDAHTNASAQLNAERILREAAGRGGVRTVFTEAAEGDVTLSGYLSPRADGSAVVRTAESLVRKGRLTGFELADLRRPGTVTLWGVEDPALYDEALEVYRQEAAARADALRFLDRARRTGEALADEFFSAEFKELYLAARRHRAGGSSTVDLFERLTAAAASRGTAVGRYPNLRLLRRLVRDEKRLDPAKVAEERIEALSALPEERRAALGPPDPAAGASIHAAYWLAVKEAGAAVRKGSQLERHIAYLDRCRKFDASAALDELERFENDVLSAAAPSDDARVLWRTLRSLETLEEIVLLKATPASFERYERERTAHDTARLTAFLNAKIHSLGRHYDRAVFLDETYEKAEASAVRFYRLSRRRDAAMAARLAARMEATGERSAVLVAGGYHAPGLKRELRSRGYSYVSVIPSATHPTDPERYEKLLLAQRTVPSLSAAPSSPTVFTFNLMLRPAAAALRAGDPAAAREVLGPLGIDPAAVAAGASGVPAASASALVGSGSRMSADRPLEKIDPAAVREIVVVHWDPAAKIGQDAINVLPVLAGLRKRFGSARIRMLTSRPRVFEGWVPGLEVIDNPDTQVFGEAIERAHPGMLSGADLVVQVMGASLIGPEAAPHAHQVHLPLIANTTTGAAWKAMFNSGLILNSRVWPEYAAPGQDWVPVSGIDAVYEGSGADLKPKPMYRNTDDGPADPAAADLSEWEWARVRAASPWNRSIAAVDALGLESEPESMAATAGTLDRETLSSWITEHMILRVPIGKDMQVLRAAGTVLQANAALERGAKPEHPPILINFGAVSQSDLLNLNEQLRLVWEVRRRFPDSPIVLSGFGPYDAWMVESAGTAQSGLGPILYIQEPADVSFHPFIEWVRRAGGGVISSDTGFAHLALAHGAPSLVLYDRDSAAEWWVPRFAHVDRLRIEKHAEDLAEDRRNQESVRRALDRWVEKWTGTVGPTTAVGTAAGMSGTSGSRMGADRLARTIEEARRDPQQKAEVVLNIKADPRRMRPEFDEPYYLFLRPDRGGDAGRFRFDLRAQGSATRFTLEYDPLSRVLVVLHVSADPGHPMQGGRFRAGMEWLARDANAVVMAIGDQSPIWREANALFNGKDVFDDQEKIRATLLHARMLTGFTHAFIRGEGSEYDVLVSLRDPRTGYTSLEAWSRGREGFYARMVRERLGDRFPRSNGPAAGSRLSESARRAARWAAVPAAPVLAAWGGYVTAGIFGGILGAAGAVAAVSVAAWIRGRMKTAVAGALVAAAMAAVAAHPAVRELSDFARLERLDGLEAQALMERYLKIVADLELAQDYGQGLLREGTEDRATYFRLLVGELESKFKADRQHGGGDARFPEQIELETMRTVLVRTFRGDADGQRAAETLARLVAKGRITPQDVDDLKTLAEMIQKERSVQGRKDPKVESELESWAGKRIPFRHLMFYFNLYFELAIRGVDEIPPPDDTEGLADLYAKLWRPGKSLKVRQKAAAWMLEPMMRPSAELIADEDAVRAEFARRMEGFMNLDRVFKLIGRARNHAEAKRWDKAKWWSFFAAWMLDRVEADLEDPRFDYIRREMKVWIQETRELIDSDRRHIGSDAVPAGWGRLSARGTPAAPSDRPQTVAAHETPSGARMAGAGGIVFANGAFKADPLIRIVRSASEEVARSYPGFDVLVTGGYRFLGGDPLRKDMDFVIFGPTGRGKSASVLRFMDLVNQGLRDTLRIERPRWVREEMTGTRILFVPNGEQPEEGIEFIDGSGTPHEWRSIRAQLIRSAPSPSTPDERIHDVIQNYLRAEYLVGDPRIWRESARRLSRIVLNARQAGTSVSKNELLTFWRSGKNPPYRRVKPLIRALGTVLGRPSDISRGRRVTFRNHRRLSRPVERFYSEDGSASADEPSVGARMAHLDEVSGALDPAAAEKLTGELAALQRGTGLGLSYDIHGDQAEESYWRFALSMIASRRRRVWTVRSASGELVGAVEAIVSSPRRSEISYLMVRSGERRSGIGTRLMDAAIAASVQAGIETLRVESTGDAIRFYEEYFERNRLIAPRDGARFEVTLPLRLGSKFPAAQRDVRGYLLNGTEGAVLQTRLGEFPDRAFDLFFDGAYGLDEQEGVLRLALTYTDYEFLETPLHRVDENLGVDLFEEIVRLDRGRRDRGTPDESITVLDFGCGEGTALQDLHRKLQDAGIRNVRLIGYSDLAYRAWLSAPPGITFIYDIEDAIDRYFAAGEVDLIYSHFGLHHVTGIDAYLPRVVRLLAPGSSLFFNLSNQNYQDQDIRSMVEGLPAQVEHRDALLKDSFKITALGARMTLSGYPGDFAAEDGTWIDSQSDDTAFGAWTDVGRELLTDTETALLRNVTARVVRNQPARAGAENGSDEKKMAVLMDSRYAVVGIRWIPSAEPMVSLRVGERSIFSGSAKELLALASDSEGADLPAGAPEAAGAVADLERSLSDGVVRLKGQPVIARHIQVRIHELLSSDPRTRPAELRMMIAALKWMRRQEPYAKDIYHLDVSGLSADERRRVASTVEAESYMRPDELDPAAARSAAAVPVMWCARESSQREGWVNLLFPSGESGLQPYGRAAYLSSAIVLGAVPDAGTALDPWAGFEASENFDAGLFAEIEHHYGREGEKIFGSSVEYLNAVRNTNGLKLTARAVLRFHPIRIGARLAQTEMARQMIETAA